MSTLKSKAGFTLVELSISMAFIGFLLIVVTYTTMQIMSIYNKGLTLKEVNSVSRLAVRDIQQSISSVNSFIINYEDDSGVVKRANSLEDASEKMQHYYDTDKGGRLCTGSFSYIWNYSDTVGVTNPANYDAAGVQYTQSGSVKKPIRFVRALDTDYSLCKYSSSVNEGTRLPDAFKYLNVFGEGNNNISLYSFEISTPMGSPVKVTEGASGVEGVVKSNITALSTFYNVKFTLGTKMGDEKITSIDASCKAPAETNLNNSEYCAINVVEFVARTGHI